MNMNKLIHRQTLEISFMYELTSIRVSSFFIFIKLNIISFHVVGLLPL